MWLLKGSTRRCPNLAPVAAAEKEQPFCVSQFQGLEMQILDFLEAGVIKKCSSNYNIPLFPVRKKTEKGQSFIE